MSDFEFGRNESISISAFDLAQFGATPEFLSREVSRLSKVLQAHWTARARWSRPRVSVLNFCLAFY